MSIATVKLTSDTEEPRGGPDLVLLSTSMAEDSVSRRLLQSIALSLSAHGAGVEVVDVRDLPHAAAGCGPYPDDYARLQERVACSDGVVVAHGIHGYSVPGAAKNLLDIVGAALAAKPVALVTAAGSERSHLAVAALATSLVFEHEVFWHPATVQVTVDSVDSEDTAARVDRFATKFVSFAALLRTYAS
jgi:NAD(P)H-dependent FMN reductase